MFFLLNQELVEICSFVKTFETEPSLQAFISKPEERHNPEKINPLSLPHFSLLELFPLPTRKRIQMC